MGSSDPDWTDGIRSGERERVVAGTGWAWQTSMDGGEELAGVRGLGPTDNGYTN